ncbi:Alpha-ketoglutarate-dependent taurine dioxygenase [Leucobacter sp. 7(1)]|uniref:(3R)-3-[(carboxymethyl)amino]fatty acid oxygenase/decarboxylase n=1 Tax=Leucobacter sp. 7(1) TaxID=1255613 RepID=UPI00097E9C45|nr:TauD/TfdA family dioxygenase [Leucobacter sp. 7(1)]SJN10490.1 Alpha-ketoglutarate-dependent taurine dioxygenase [Leucobacter sp. 7(1)]
MIVEQGNDDTMGVVVKDFNVDTVTSEDIDRLKQSIYRDKVAVLRNQGDITPEQFVKLGRMFGDLVSYHEPMYHHPDFEEIFVSSNIPEDGKQIGVPKTGKFWHADYQFMPQPFAFTIFSPKVLPPKNRGTFFINMAAAYEALPQELKDAAAGTTCSHSVRKFFKIRPDDVYRPLGEIIREVEEHTPAVTFPTVMEHPVTGEKILFISEGFTVELNGSDDPDLLDKLFEATGQLDQEFAHPNIYQHAYEPGDIVIWDNRTLIHRALHTTTPAATVSHRVTALDGLPLYARAL